jgi:hypothetical protein
MTVSPSFYDSIGAPDWIRTSGPQIRNLMLYPAELRVLDWLSLEGALAAVNCTGLAGSRERAGA